MKKLEKSFVLKFFESFKKKSDYTQKPNAKDKTVSLRDVSNETKEQISLNLA
jgi:hypothetical protein